MHSLLQLPVREGLLAYLRLLQAEAQADWDVRRLMWAAGVQFGQSKQCPAPPALLGDDDA